MIWYRLLNIFPALATLNPFLATFGYLLVTMARATWNYRRPNTIFPLDRCVPFQDNNSQEKRKEGGGERT